MTVTFPSGYIGFNASTPQVCHPDGSVLWPGVDTTFSNANWTTVGPQYKNDMVFLANCGVKLVRVWPTLGTFYLSGGVWQSTPNSAIANWDDFLNTIGNLGMQVQVVLLDTPESSGQLTASYLTPSLLNNPTVQAQWIATVSDFLTRYKNDTRIWGYDLSNELHRVITNGGVLFGTTFDSSPWTDLGNYCSALYTAAKSIDSLHYFTFSMGNVGTGSTSDTVIGTNVDFYDIHMYVGQFQQPSNLWQGYTAYGKPTVCFEIGTTSMPNDLSIPSPHAPCETDSYNVAPELSTWCQTYLFQLCQLQLFYAKQNGIKYCCFHAFPDFRWFSIRTDDGTEQWLGHKLTIAGQFLLLTNGHQIASWV